MSNFANAQVTLRGNNLLARALEGETLTFTRIVMGDGEYSGAIMEAQSLVNQKKELNITKLTRKESIVTIGGLLELGNLTEEFYWRELGVYAKGTDNVEVLYMYGNAGDKASYITNTGLDEKLIDINIVVGNASNVSAIIDSSLVFLTEDNLRAHDDYENAHPALKVWVQSLFASGDWAKYSQAEQIINDTVQIKNSIGEESDSINKATIFGLGNKIISLINGVSNAFVQFRNALTDARAANLDRLDVYVSSRSDKVTTDTIKTIIGSTADTGGSTTTGTIMAKLNAILNWFTGTWTAARAAKLDKVGTTGDYLGKKLVKIPKTNIAPGNKFTYTNNKGGLLRFTVIIGENKEAASLKVDGEVICTDTPIYCIGIYTYSGGTVPQHFDCIIPFSSSVEISSSTNNERDVTISGLAYINK